MLLKYVPLLNNVFTCVQSCLSFCFSKRYIVFEWGVSLSLKKVVNTGWNRAKLCVKIDVRVQYGLSLYLYLCIVFKEVFDVCKEGCQHMLTKVLN